MSSDEVDYVTSSAKLRPLSGLWPFLRFSFLAFIFANIALGDFKFAGPPVFLHVSIQRVCIR